MIVNVKILNSFRQWMVNNFGYSLRGLGDNMNTLVRLFEDKRQIFVLNYYEVT